MAGEDSRCSRRRSWRHAVYAGGEVGRRYSHQGQTTAPGTVALHQLALYAGGSTGASVQVREPEPVNILTAMAENASVVKTAKDPERKAIALTWLFHLVGDIHQPLHTAQLFTVEYPKGDRGGNEICVRVTQAGQPMDLHRFWDGVITSSSNVTRFRNEATTLRNRQEFQRDQLTELGNTDFDAWAKESYEIATKIAYRNDGRIGIPRGGNMDCTMVAAAPCFRGATLLARDALLMGG
jgi:hypothetical protein